MLRLPDFRGHETLNTLRRAMGARLIEYWQAASTSNLSDEEIEHLETGGIEIDPVEIEINNDGTLEYAGRRVLVYIRDQRPSYIGVRGNNRIKTSYKFHVAECSTLTSMKKGGRYESRYVITARTDGLFLVRWNEGGRIREEEVPLKVCKNCLTKLDYKGYARKWKEAANDIYRNFSIQEFFDMYQGSQVEILPLHTESTAPLDDYPENWDEIARNYKETKQWVCEHCCLDFSKQKHLLHVHHKDGNRSNSKPSNLVVLCHRCHRKEPKHGLM